MTFFIDSILYSYAQIFFSNRRWLGAVLLAGTFLAPHIGLVSLLGVVIANLVAYTLKFDEAKIKSGFYGFNGILFGAGAAFYFELTPFLLALVILFIVITFFIAAVLEHLLASVVNLPGLSLPFVISLFIFVIFLSNFNTINPNILQSNDEALFSFLPYGVKAYLRSLALIFFQPNIFTGALFALALLFLSRVMFILSLTGFLIGSLTLHLLFPAPSDSMTILAGFNSILTACALGGNLVIPSRKSLVLTLIASVLVVVLTAFFYKLLVPYALPVLVLPFNFLTLSVIYSLKFRREQSDIVLLYFLPGTPEENYYYHHNRLARFERFKTVVPELPFFGEWRISQGHSGAHTHKDRWRFAWDFTVVDETGSEFSGDGNLAKDYYCYNLPVVAPLDGTVVRVVKGVQENAIGEANLQSNWGNTVVLDHGSGIFSAASHLEQFSIKVSVGDVVKKGDPLGACGNSGRSPVPHVHFQFQPTDKLGDKTTEYPFGQYVERRNGALILHAFDHPTEGMLVQNLGTNKTMKKAFDFKLGDKLQFHCVAGKTEFDEEWEVKVDIYNTLYIESSRNATVTVALVGKVFYLTNFVGNRQSALYHFYLTAVQVPLSYEPNLHWTDQYPISRMLANQIRYLSEFFILFAPQLRAHASFAFKKNSAPGQFIISNVIDIVGSGVFASYKRRRSGEISISDEGRISRIDVHAPSEFSATAIISEEE
ncbi:MAG: urea transporter [Ignavibacteriae bacterium]|nr:urea transporter [Ignavibacteriota bacterium]